MDAIDREILGVLQEDGRITATDLARRIGLGVSATSERLRQLRRSGVVRHFAAIVNPLALGRPIEALIDVRLASGVRTDDVDALVRSMGVITDAVHLTGRFDMQLRVAARDVAELDLLLVHLKENEFAEETNTRLVLRSPDGFPRAPEPA